MSYREGGVYEGLARSVAARLSPDAMRREEKPPTRRVILAGLECTAGNGRILLINAAIAFDLYIVCWRN